jgi:hypothetical protein
MDSACSKEYYDDHGEENTDSSPMGSEERQEEVCFSDTGATKGDRPECSTSTMGSIYIVETKDKRLIKFGYTSRLTMRLAQVEYMAKVKLNTSVRLIGFFPGTHATEAIVHRRFSECRYYGDWYRREAVLRKLSLEPILPPLLASGERPPQRSTGFGPTPAASALAARRMVKMTPAQRQAVAKNAAETRWSKRKKKA